ncbi:MAG: hypothetical protein A2782_04620 [Candidatus Blackburnbacteria bacterium RIFCSPHIGHO2_01_FULL_43_15b]|uniref:Uncharacterized protein n=1 Tax=Candidatus Blackburnbacteria bacterium RIFCSPHIGHO2_01_FULL_43_15b TaxID=1797513 RepID=A0A1G1V3M3_9BACT|nr:MAG: hypothetical protein A2782_04620 [Candidatus Blackburnbacteria bacterium RIFCSPHIGHO2_01_FULL_43_15b]
MITAERRYSSVEFASSISHESRLVADPYVLWWTEKGLYSPNHRCLVRSCIQENSPDMAAYDFLEDVVRKETEGTVFWFSPALNPCESHKILGTEIYTAENGRKITFNFAVLFLRSEISTEQFVGAANGIAEYAKEAEISDALERRKRPIFLNGTTVHWTHFADLVLPNKEWERIRNKEVWLEKREILRAIRRGDTQIYGGHPLSCPLNAFDAMFMLGDSVMCPNCQRVVRVAKGEMCPGCGKTRPRFGCI